MGEIKDPRGEQGKVRGKGKGKEKGKEKKLKKGGENERKRGKNMGYLELKEFPRR